MKISAMRKTGHILSGGAGEDLVKEVTFETGLDGTKKRGNFRKKRTWKSERSWFV